MGIAMFYHLTQRPLEETLAMLLRKSRAAGWRVLIRGQAAELERLDAALWQGPEDDFLPHGLAGGPHDADQPILLTAAAETPEGFDCLMSVQGAPVTPAEVREHERVCVLFDGNDPAALDVARAQWKDLKEAGAQAQYWTEASGQWEMKAQT